MYFIFLFTSLFLLVLANRRFKKIINPVSLYIFIWNLMIGLYELKLVHYNEITMFAWVTVILFEIIFAIACLAGSRCRIINLSYYDDEDGMKGLRKWICILSIISALAIIPNFVNFIRRYSFHFMSSINLVYQNRLDNTRGYEVIPYLGTLSYLALIFAAVYFRRYGFHLVILIPLALTVLDTLPSGGRAGIILAAVMFLSPILLYKRKGKNTKFKIGKKGKISIAFIVGALGVLFWQLSIVRSTWIAPNQYMTPTMVKLVNISPAIYKTYAYITMPFVTLSEYLKDPDFSFGINTFGMFNNILNKLGLNLDYQRYQDVYYVPMACNAGTYIRELIQDFTYVGGVLATIFFAFIFGLTYSETIKRKSIYTESMSALLSTITVMSFFMFFYRESVFWFVTIFMPIVTHFIYSGAIIGRKKQ